MKSAGVIPASWSPQLLSAARIVIAFLYMSHGLQKLFAYPGDGTGHTVALGSIFGAAGIIETFGGGLILIGLGTRFAAFVCCGEMAVAYFMFHASGGFWPILNHGEIVVAFCFFFLYVAAAGPGPWSVDAAMSKAD